MQIRARKIEAIQLVVAHGGGIMPQRVFRNNEIFPIGKVILPTNVPGFPTVNLALLRVEEWTAGFSLAALRAQASFIIDDPANLLDQRMNFGMLFPVFEVVGIVETVRILSLVVLDDRLQFVQPLHQPCFA